MNCPICKANCPKDKELYNLCEAYPCNNCQINFSKQNLFFYIQHNSITNSVYPTSPQQYVEYWLSTHNLVISNTNIRFVYKQVVENINHIKPIALKFNKLNYL